METKKHSLPEHNAACERAKLSSCNCYCHGAGHQHNLIWRAVSCKTGGKNGLSQLLRDLEDIYGGFHADLRDSITTSRRAIPDHLSTVKLDRGRGATWTEQMMADEALHSAFIKVAKSSVALSEAERKNRKKFVTELTEGALQIVGQAVDSHNICDGHLWCSILAEANKSASLTSFHVTGLTSDYGKICYPRKKTPRIPSGLSKIQGTGVIYVKDMARKNSQVVGLSQILKLIGAASCPDLWHHPAAVRYSLLPFVKDPTWPPNNTTKLAKFPNFNILESRWSERKNW